jgi:uncharacterized integral membrane protein
MMAVKFVLGLLLVFFLVTFATQNQQEVTVSYYGGYTFTINLWVAILVSFGLGAILVSLGAGFSIMMLKSKNWSLGRQVTKLDDKICELKQKPLPDEPTVYPTHEAAVAEVAPASEPKALPQQASSSNN